MNPFVTALVLAALLAPFACQMVNQANIPALNATLTGLGELRW